ncbi:MAG TPA: hypothetical protein VNU24_03205 [Solirubrobacteraceae bacterium]|nr:hypothetical protein [Solirubrobacteraceae bacterium]
MAFESKRLRVQLPCGDTSVHEQEARAIAFGGGVITHNPTCARSIVYPTCGQQGSIMCYWCTYTLDPMTPYGTLCTPIGSPVPHFGREEVEVEIDQLPVIRAQLELQLKQVEEQLKEVEVAEAAVAEREAGA